MPELNRRAKRFVQEYMVDHCGKAAAIRAGYGESNAHHRACILLQDPRVRSEIEKLTEAQRERLEIKADEVLGELLKIGMANPANLFDAKGNLKQIHKLPRELTACIRSVRRSWDRWGKRPTFEISFWDKPKCLETLARHLGLLSDNTNIRFPDGIPKDLVGMSDVELDSAIEQEAAKIKRARK